MRFTIRLLLASLLVFQNALAWAGPSRKSAVGERPEAGALKQVAALFPQKKKLTVEEFLKIYEKQTSESYLQNLKQRAKPHFKETLEFEVLGPARFVIRDNNGNEALMEVLDLEGGHFKLNNRKVSLDFSKPPEEVTEEVLQTLSNRTSRHPLPALLLPRAEALDWGTLLGIGLGVSVVGLGIYNYSNCNKYDDLYNRCNAVIANTSAAQAYVLQLYNEVRDLNQKFMTFFCSKKDAVKACEAQLAVRIASPGMKYDGPRLVTPAVQ